MVVMKFGGTSVQDSQVIQKVIEIVRLKNATKKLVVVSAFSKVTDQLIKMIQATEVGDGKQALEMLESIKLRHIKTAKELSCSESLTQKLDGIFLELSHFTQALGAIGEVSVKSYDRIVSVGEVCCSLIIADAANAAGLKSLWIDSRDVLKTDNSHTKAQVDFKMTTQKATELVAPYLGQNTIWMGGFIGSDHQNRTTTLGRGGSDYSASVMGSVLNAKRIEIWTDVDGILTTDPRIVSSAKKLDQVSFEEASELAYFGAKVLHPSTIFPAIEKNIPVFVLNTFNPSGPGSEIVDKSQLKLGIKAVAFKKNIVLVNLNSTRMLGAFGFLEKVFALFSKHHVSVDLVSTSEVNVSVTCEMSTIENLLKIKSEISEFCKMEIIENCASISIVGHGMQTESRDLSKILGSLRGIKIQMVSMGASDINFSFVVAATECDKAVKKLHETFFDKEMMNGVNS